MRVFLDRTNRMQKPATMEEALQQIRLLRIHLAMNTAMLDYSLSLAKGTPFDGLAGGIVGKLQSMQYAEDELNHCRADGIGVDTGKDDPLEALVLKVGRIMSPSWGEAVKRGLVKDDDK